MTELKELKSIELASFTTILTTIEVIFAIIISLIIAIPMSVLIPTGSSLAIYLIPTIIVGTLIYATYSNFLNGFIYNMLAKKLKTINVVIKDGEEILEISTTETAIICSIIITIQFILCYLASVFVVPIFISSIMQTLMYSGQMEVATMLYQLLLIVSQPTTILILIFGIFIISFVFTLLGTFIYNILANAGHGIKLNLSNDNKMTVIESINIKKFTIASTIIIGVLNIIFTIIMMISSLPATSAIINIIAGFVGGAIIGLLVAIFYNYLSPIFDKLKLELIDK